MPHSLFLKACFRPPHRRDLLLGISISLRVATPAGFGCCRGHRWLRRKDGNRCSAMASWLGGLGIFPDEETHGLFRKMTDEHLDSISRLTELRHISTNHLGNGSERIALVPPAHGGKMRIVDPLVTDCGLEHLSRLDRLECLILFNTAVTDNGVAQLKHLKNLQQLMIASDAITDESVVHLSAIRSLRRLWICGTSITSQGAAHCSVHYQIAK